MHEPGRGYPRALLRKLLLSELSRHLLLRGAAMPGFARRYGVLQVASSLHHRSRVTIKPWPHVCQPFVVKAGNLQTLQILAFRIFALPCNVQHRHTIVLGSRLKPCSSPAALRGQAGEFQLDAPRLLAEPRNVSLCGAEPCDAIVLGFRLKPCPPSAALRGEADENQSVVAHDNPQLRTAEHCCSMPSSAPTINGAPIPPGVNP